MNQGYSGVQIKYKEAILPFGVIGDLLVWVAISLAFISTLYILEEVYGVGNMSNIILFVAIFFFVLAPSMYYFIPSCFEKNRVPKATFHCRGSANLTTGGLRLLIYNDGVEIRVMFHRFFVPYNDLEHIPKPEKVGYFRGIHIVSNIEGVPSPIGIYGYRIRKIAITIQEMKDRYLEMQAN